jgi:hypothetical protein
MSARKPAPTVLGGPALLIRQRVQRKEQRLNEATGSVDYAVMSFRLLPLAAALLSAACGITSRHVIGPTIDSNGHFGLLVSASIGPVVGCARKVAVPVRAGVGVAAEEQAGTDYDGALALDLGVGVDWLFSTPGGDRGATPLAESLARPATPAAPERPDQRSQLGKRLGLRTGLLHVGQVDAWSLGASGTITMPLPRNLFALGVEGGCDVLLLKSGRDAPVFRCDLGVVFDVTNLHAVETDRYR